jgi:hypothetical protein
MRHVQGRVREGSQAAGAPKGLALGITSISAVRTIAARPCGGTCCTPEPTGYLVADAPQVLGQLASQGFQLYAVYDEFSLVLVTPKKAYVSLAAQMAQPTAAKTGVSMAAAALPGQPEPAGAAALTSSAVHLQAIKVAARQLVPAAQVQADVSSIHRLPNISYAAQEILYEALGQAGRRLRQQQAQAAACACESTRLVLW